jgi:hypothetical protein
MSTCNTIDLTGGCTHESIRIRYVRENTEACYTPNRLTLGICPAKCPYLSTSPVQKNINSESARLFQKINACPYYDPPDNPGGLCPESVPASSGGYKRAPFRITGIDQVAVNVRSLSSSEITSRRRYSAVQSNVRHAEHFRTHPPPPPCRSIQTTPTPGVPYAPDGPCIPGNQRVDYSNSRR